MQITVQLPDDIQAHENPDREALEALVIAGFSSGTLSAYQARVLLGLESKFAFDAYVKEHQIEGGSYGLAEFEEDVATLSKLDSPAKRSA
ncbi:MAG TPA: UPF0175 family protein [Acidobacteriaceae bacterium]|nr:UPF0175 family protein [Acidobacteriaceae bacterium]